MLDYRQTITAGRFVKCYVHFKTNNLTEALYGRFFVFSDDTAAHVGFKRMSLKKGTVETEWTQHPNEVKSSTTSIDASGITVKHDKVGSFTHMGADGFSICDSATGDVMAWLSSRTQWTELKVDKVFAGNLENLYEGPSNLYVDHSKTTCGDGSSSSPFNSFAALQDYLEKTPCINKDLYITVRDPKSIIWEQLRLQGLHGGGFIKIVLEGTLVISSPGNGLPAIYLTQINKWVWILGGRTFGTSDTGIVIQDNPNVDGGGHGIIAYDVSRLEVDALTISTKNWGILTDRTDLFTYNVDFGKCYTAVEARSQSIYYSYDDVGSNTNFCILKGGSKAFWGSDSNGTRPLGKVQCVHGIYYSFGNGRTETASTRFPVTPPSPPVTSQVYTQTFNWTSHRTYQYQWSNWGDDDCKQGSWGYGLRGGHMFFDISGIRNWMGSGTVQDGNSITLTRANSGGLSGGSNVYINGSSCSSASGTPSYGGQTHLGTLAWGETKTFTLPKAIVEGLKNGSYNSLAVYVNSSANNNYINIVNCSITLKVKK